MFPTSNCAKVTIYMTVTACCGRHWCGCSPPPRASWQKWDGSVLLCHTEQINCAYIAWLRINCLYISWQYLQFPGGCLCASPKHKAPPQAMWTRGGYWDVWVPEADWDWQGSSEWHCLGLRPGVVMQLPRLTSKLQAAMGSFQEPLVVGCRFDHLGKKQEKKRGGKKRKIKLFSEIMFNVEIWLILNRNLQFSSIVFLKENVSCSRAASIKGSLITSLPMSDPTSLQHALVYW